MKHGISEEQKEQIKKMTRRHIRQSAIARAMGVSVATVRYWQLALALPTQVVLNPKEVVALDAQGWSVERIGKRFARRPTVIAEILRSERCRKAKAQRTEKEAKFRAAARLREANIRELAERFGISLFRAYRIAHKELGASAFRRGPAKAENLPMAAVEPPPVAPLDPPDLYVAALTQFFNIFNDGRATPPERDSEILVKFLRFIPPDAPDFVRQHVAFSLVHGLDSLRRQAAAQWLH